MIKNLHLECANFIIRNFINKKANNSIFKIRQNVSLTDISIKDIYKWQINT